MTHCSHPIAGIENLLDLLRRQECWKGGKHDDRCDSALLGEIMNLPEEWSEMSSK